MAIRYLSGINVDSNTLFVDDANNRVGIGTGSPTAKLHVKDTSGANSLIAVRVENSQDYGELGTQSGYVRLLSGGNLVYAGSDGITFFYNGGNPIMTTTYLGNVGIGTTSPSSKLHVVGAANGADASNIRIDSTSEFGGLLINENTTFRTILGYGNAGNIFSNAQTDSTSLRGANYLHLGASSAATITINGSNDYVGIGTTSPSYKLDVNGATQIQNELILSTNDAAFRLYRTTGINYFDWSSGQDLRFSTVTTIGGAGRSTAVTFLSDGNVGIGTTSTFGRLQISGTVVNPDLSSATATGVSLVISNSDTGYGTMFATYGNGNGALQQRRTNTNTYYDFLLQPHGGNVGIGTTSPGYKLDVNGDVNIPFGTSNGYRINGNRILSQGSGFFEFGALDYKSTYPNISTNSDGTFRIQSNGSTLVTVNQSGNVGIGTTSPSQKLEVAGALVVGMTVPAPFWNAQFKDFNDGSGIYISSVNGGGGKYIAGNAYYYNSTLWRSDKTVASAINLDNGTVVFYTNSGLTPNVDYSPTERMRITAAGNVGIGTTIATSRLHVLLNGNASGGPTGNLASFQNSSSGSNAYITLFGAYDAESGIVFTDESEQFKGKLGYNNVSEYMYFQTDGSERMRINQDGNVGIGTTSPGAKLEVNGNILFSTKANSLIFGATGADGTWGAPLITRIGSQIIMSDYGGVQFGGYDGSAYGARMTVLGTGNVGIGTTSPTEILELSTTTDPKIRFVDVGNTDAKIGIVGSTALGFEVNGSERMRIASTGATRLNAYGSGSFTGTVAYNLAVDSSGNVIETAGGVVDGSGTANYVSKWSDANTLTNSLLYDNGSTISIGLGSTTPSYTNAYGYPQFAIESNAFASSHVFTHNDTNGNFSFFALGKSKGTAAAPTIVENSETIGDFQFWAYDGAAYRNTAFIRNQIDGEPGAGDVPGRLVFGTTNDGSSSASEKMRITSAGNVGIGNTAPAHKLDISGDLNVNHTANVVAIRVGGIAAIGRGLNTDGTRINGGSTDGIEFTPNNDATIKMVIKPSGNVGIGTASPAYKLDVVGSVRLTNAASQLILDNATYSELNYGTSNYFRANGSQALINGPSIAFLTGGTEKVRIDSSGNVGIGTTSPSHKFVVSNGSAEVFQVYNSGEIIAGTNYIYAAYSGGTSFYSQGPASFRNGIYSDTAAYLTINGGTSNNTYFSGNVGIGTTSPSTRLEVLGDTEVITIRTSYPSNLSQRGGLLWKDATNITGAIDTRYDGTTVDMYFGSLYNSGYNSTTRMVIKGNGNVGIGTTAPGYKLDVSGTAYVSDDLLVGATNATSWHRISVATGGFIAQDGGRGIGAYVDSTAADFFAYNYSVGSYIPLTIGTSTLNIRNNGGSSIIYHDGTNVGINTTAPESKLHVVYGAGEAGLLSRGPSGDTWFPYTNGQNYVRGVTNFDLGGVYFTGGNVGIGTTSPSQALHVSGNIRVTGAYYDSSNSAGSSGQVLSSTGSGTAWVNQGEATATSLYDLLPAARTTYAWSVQLTAGTWADIFSSNTVLSNGTWMVQVYVDDWAVGGQQYQETYSGVMSWGSASSTNQGGAEAISEVVLHRSGHAANSGNFYLRTVERVTSTLLLQGMSNQTYSAASTINFKFVKIF